MLDLLNQIISRAEQHEPVAVCALVRTRGSTPQRAGAIMLVLADGRTLGTIGGGCVEAEVRSRALQLMAAGQSRLLPFELDHDHGWDDGLVCGGTMDVAVQIVASPEQAAGFLAARDRIGGGESAELEIAVADERFRLPLKAPPALVIAGAGHVAAALAVIVRPMDFSVTVIDDRADFATAERFPAATCRIGDVDTELAKLTPDRNTYVVIVTRGHRRDALALAAVIRSQARYIGLIGSRRKIVQIFRDLKDQGVTLEQLSRVHAPVGLKIGAVTPAEIAVSIAAELIAVRRSAVDTPPSMQLSDAILRRMFDD